MKQPLKRSRLPLSNLEGCDRRFSAVVAFRGLNKELAPKVLLQDVRFTPSMAWVTGHVWVGSEIDTARFEDIEDGDVVEFTAYVERYRRSNGSVDFHLVDISHLHAVYGGRARRSQRTGAEERLAQINKEKLA